MNSKLIRAILSILIGISGLYLCLSGAIGREIVTLTPTLVWFILSACVMAFCWAWAELDK